MEIQLSRINTNLLVALDLLLEEKSVSRAAERQGVTPSAMSHSLRQLRELFGDILLIRGSHGMRLSARAERLATPLKRALRGLEEAVQDSGHFDPATASRYFVIGAPDFIGTLLSHHLLESVGREAPGVDIELRPSARRGNLWFLEEGMMDLAIGALLGDSPGFRTETLYKERFVVIARADHPRLGDTLDLESYAAESHALITISDERSPTWIDTALESRGLKRQVAFRSRSFMSVPLLVARSELITTCPYQLARYFARSFPLRIYEPPLDLPAYREEQQWHARFDHDPAHQWLRSKVQEAAGHIRAETDVPEQKPVRLEL